jgi:hypothetical protein
VGLKKGKQKKMEPNSRSKETKGEDKEKIHYEGSKSDLPTDIDDEIYDDNISYDD